MSDQEKPTPPRKAVAARYDMHRDQVPRVVAKGERLVAEQIIERAREHGIQLYEDPDLVAVLSKIDIDTEIPENLFRAVAEVLAFVYRVNATYPGK